MKRTVRPRRGFFYWLASGICLRLICTSFPLNLTAARNPTGLNSKSRLGSNNGQGRRVNPPAPRSGPPDGNLPNLDEARSARNNGNHNGAVVQAPPPIPSTKRSRKKPEPHSPGNRIVKNLAPALSPNSGENYTAQADLNSSTQRKTRSHHARTSSGLKAPANSAAAAAFVPQSQRVNVALSVNGGVATASSNTPDSYFPPLTFSPGGVIDGARTGWGNHNAWRDKTDSVWPDWLQVDLNGTKTIDEIGVVTVQDNPDSTTPPDESMTFTLYGPTAFNVQFWNGSSWANVPNGGGRGNNQVLRKFSFSPITKNKIRVVVNNALNSKTRIVELEAWGYSVPPPLNVALAANGAVATASSNAPDSYAPPLTFSPAGAIDGARTGWGNHNAWRDYTDNAWSDWLQVDFNASKTITEVDVVTVQDNPDSTTLPDESMTFTLYGITAFDVQYWNGSSWANIPNGSVTGNNKVLRKFSFSPITTSKIRVLVNNALYSNSRIVELEAWTSPADNLTSSQMAMARLNPLNRTGGTGEDLLSNNYNWSLPLVGLPGRGLDLGLTLSYNSLVWTKSGNYIDFDVDDGSVSPGFRLGFPTIEGPYWNEQAAKSFYLLVTPSGGRVELRYSGSGAIYESQDSNHLQLIDYGTNLLVRPTDGSQLNFTTVSGSWRCNKITDSNGNFISVTYKSWAEIETITDTLGRVLTFNYDTNANVQSITQSWAGQTHVWATFGWTTIPIGDNFAGLTNLGPNSTSIPALTQVGLPDGSRYTYDYSSYGQVSTIHYYASDSPPPATNHQRRYTNYIYSTSANDCPRVSQRRDWAESWNGINGVPAEVVTQFSHETDGACRAIMPDGTIYKEYYGSGWSSGLSTLIAVWIGGSCQKWTKTASTQYNTGISYQTNPRVTKTNIYDSQNNRRRTTIDYAGYAQWGLPNGVFEYAADGATVLRATYTDYNLSQAYLDRHIIGLVSAVNVSDGSWQSKITYGYDDPAQLQAPPATTIPHDPAYGTSLTARGNVTSGSRWDITDGNSINDSTKALTSRVGYDTNGSVVWSRDPAGHQSNISYDDSFADSINRNTFAYPTKIKDPDWNASTAPNNYSTTQYNFDFGAVTRTQGPKPAGQSQGAIEIATYDGAARLQQVTTQNNGAYTRYEYGPNYVQSFSTVNAIADEAYAMQVLDGADRVIGVVSNHPASTGGYSLVNKNYDSMGRIKSQSNPTEVNSYWSPTGDDAAGFIYTQQTYDWKGRPLVTTNTDGTQKYASYGGCGCAGGEVVTLTDEVGRQQKVYSDGLGRQRKTEVLNWNGTVYSTTTNNFNVRDQVTLVRQYQGTEQSTVYQDTTMGYDGYGRLQSKHLPEQDPGTATVYTYNPGDTMQAVADARGASATYSYNNRHLVTSINYSAPSGITPTSTGSFFYDPAGNRTQMVDGLGGSAYSFAQLARLTSETSTFNGVGTFTLSYDYNLAGELKRITDAPNSTINYSFDAIGRLNSVTGSDNLVGGVAAYTSSFSYRAWGGLKTMTDGSSQISSALTALGTNLHSVTAC